MNAKATMRIERKRTKILNQVERCRVRRDAKAARAEAEKNRAAKQNQSLCDLFEGVSDSDLECLAEQYEMTMPIVATVAGLLSVIGFWGFSAVLVSTTVSTTDSLIPTQALLTLLLILGGIAGISVTGYILLFHQEGRARREEIRREEIRRKKRFNEKSIGKDSNED